LRLINHQKPTPPVPLVVAIISLRELLRFTFNPFGVEASQLAKTTGSTGGYSYAALSGLKLLNYQKPQVYLA
jgi:hypothetical protein